MLAASWIAAARRSARSRPVVVSLALQHQPDLFERPRDGHVGRRRVPSLSAGGFAPRPSGFVVTAGSGQGATQVIERLATSRLSGQRPSRGRRRRAA